MLSSLGKFLRTLRIQRDELLKDMAIKLGVVPAYLSSIENGKRTPTKSLILSIEKAYNLSQTECDELYSAYYDTVNEVNINIHLASLEQRNLCITFARRLEGLDDEQIQKISEILEEMDI